MNRRRVVTFDLFSALIDSRTGGSAALDAARACPRLAGRRGSQLYDAWDPRNKAAQRDCAGVGAVARSGAAARSPRPTPTSGSTATRPRASRHSSTRCRTGRCGPTCPPGCPRCATQWRVGLLSNVDDDLFASTAAAPLVDHDVALTSERLGVYKPHAEIYRRAVDERRAAGARGDLGPRRTRGAGGRDPDRPAAPARPRGRPRRSAPHPRGHLDRRAPGGAGGRAVNDQLGRRSVGAVLLGQLADIGVVVLVGHLSQGPLDVATEAARRLHRTRTDACVWIGEEPFSDRRAPGPPSRIQVRRQPMPGPRRAGSGQRDRRRVPSPRH